MNFPSLPPLEGPCPAHPFEKDHDSTACRERRLNQALAYIRGSHGLALNEYIWALEYALFRAKWNQEPTPEQSFGDVPKMENYT